MFGDPRHNSKGLVLGRIGDLLNDVQYGTSAKAGADGAFPILRMGNITPGGRLSLGDLKRIDLAQNEIDNFTVRNGDILFNRTNSAELVCKTAVFDRSERFAFAGYLVRARTRKGVSPYYISGYLNSQHGKTTLRNRAKSIVDMANINAKEMQNIHILIASSDDQSKFESIVKQIFAHRCERSEATQSHRTPWVCFVAALLAMTAVQ